MNTAVCMWEVKDVADEETRAKWRQYTNKYNERHREQVNEKKRIARKRYVDKQLETNEEEFRRKHAESNKKYYENMSPEAKAAMRERDRERLRAWRAKKRAEKAALAALKADGPDD